jgi:endonuclease G
VLHNCTTLGGNSGSVVLDLDTGEALGLHFSGSFLRTNYAVRADRVKERLDALLAGTLRTRREGPVRSRPSRRPAAAVTAASGGSAMATRDASGTRATLTVPLTITVSFDGGSALAPGRRPAPMPLNDDGDDGGDRVADEARPEDYKNRKGYNPAFLGSDMAVELPTIVKGSPTS